MKKQLQITIVLVLIAVLAVSGTIFMSGIIDIGSAGKEESEIQQIVNETAVIRLFRHYMARIMIWLHISSGIQGSFLSL